LIIIIIDINIIIVTNIILTII